MLALFLKIPKMWPPKGPKINIFTTPLSFDTPLQGTPANIPIVLYCQKLQSLYYIFTADSAELSWSKFSQWALKTHVFWNKVRNGRSRSSTIIDFGTNWKRICDFLLVTNSNLGRILPV